MTKRKTDPTPWGFAATSWQAFAFILLGILALSNAAWFYSLRVAKAEAAAAKPTPAATVTERVIYQTADGREVEQPQVPSYRPAPPLGPDERCIGGQRIRETPQGFTQLETPC